MLNQSLDDLIPKVRTYAPGIPDPTALRCLRQAARIFCANTGLWRETETVNVTTPHEEEIDLFRTIEAEVIGVLSARLDGADLTPVTPEWLDAHCAGWDDDTTETGAAAYIMSRTPDTITLYPRQTGTLRAKFILQPRDDAETIAAFLAARHGETLAIGAAGMALVMPGKDFTNPDLGVGLESRFRSQVNTEKWRTAKSNVRVPLRTAGRYF